MRKRIYSIIEIAKDGDQVSRVYDITMIITIIVSLIPLVFKTDNSYLKTIDRITVIIFIIDYLLRWATSDLKLAKGKLSFAVYPFTLMAIIDMLSILPSLTVLNSGFKVLRVLRMARTFRVFKVFKTVRYSKSIKLISNVLKNSKDSLIAVCTLAIGYIFISALILFNVEPESFDTFFDAIYWATTALTTVGYGDLYPVSVIGRTIGMISSLFGIAIVALPAGIITAGYMEELSKRRGAQNEDNEKTETVNEDLDGSNED